MNDLDIGDVDRDNYLAVGDGGAAGGGGGHVGVVRE